MEIDQWQTVISNSVAPLSPKQEAEAIDGETSIVYFLYAAGFVNT